VSVSNDDINTVSRTKLHASFGLSRSGVVSKQRGAWFYTGIYTKRLLGGRFDLPLAVMANQVS
jgi:hypothetical protein